MTSEPLPDAIKPRSLKHSGYLLAFTVDLAFGLLVPFSYLRLVDVPLSADNHLAVKLMVAANIVRVLLWSLPFQRGVAPIERWLAARDAGEDTPDDMVLAATKAAYAFPRVLARLTGLGWLLAYVGVTIGLFYGSAEISWSYHTLVATVLFSMGLGGGAYVGALGLDLLLMSGPAGELSLVCRDRGIPLPGTYRPFMHRLGVAALAFALSPTAFIASMGYMFDVNANLDAAELEAQAAVLGVAEVGPSAPGLQFSLSGDDVVSSPSAKQLFDADPPLQRWASKSVAAADQGVSTDNRRRYALAFRTNRSGSKVAVLRPIEDPSSLSFLAALALFGLLVIAWALVSAAFLAVSAARPVGRIADQINEIGSAGRVSGSRRIPTYFRDEIGSLAIGANEMMDRLQESYEGMRTTLKELERRNVQLTEASRAKSQFLANMSHEFRTPLNAILGFSRIILRKSKDQLDDRQTKNLGLIQSSGEHLLALVNDLLDFQKVEAGMVRVHEEDVELGQLLEDVKDTLGPAVKEAGLQLAIDVPEPSPVLRTDRDRLNQILINLATNAIKYSESGTVTLGVHLRPKASPPHIEIAVNDEGIGIEPEQLEHIFDPFHQVDSSYTREREGTGLGLAIVERLATLLGGEVGAHSELGKGSTFTVRFPLRKLLERATDEEDDAVPSSNGPLVLVVDDDEATIEMFRQQLIDAGYRVEGATSGQAGLDKARAIEPDAILLDILMPDMDGWHVMHELQRQESTRDIPVIVVSGTEQTARAMNLGVSRWITKPVDPEDLLDALRQSIEDPHADVLVVEDDAGTRELLQQQLQDVGARLRFEETGMGALRACKERLPNLLVLDLGLPDMNGLDVLVDIRKLPGADQIHVVVYTGLDLSRDDRDKLKKSAADLVRKHGTGSVDRILSEIRRTGPKVP